MVEDGARLPPRGLSGPTETSHLLRNVLVGIASVLFLAVIFNRHGCSSNTGSNPSEAGPPSWDTRFSADSQRAYSFTLPLAGEQVHSADSLYSALLGYPPTDSTRTQPLLSYLSALPCYKDFTIVTCDALDGSELSRRPQRRTFTLAAFLRDPSLTYDEVRIKQSAPPALIRRVAALQKRVAALKSKYGWDDATCLTIAGGKISIGMTPAMVIAAWGRPEDINRTTTSYRVHEQWVYGSNYVYLEGPSRAEMAVTSIQN